MRAALFPRLLQGRHSKHILSDNLQVRLEQGRFRRLYSFSSVSAVWCVRVSHFLCLSCVTAHWQQGEGKENRTVWVCAYHWMSNKMTYGSSEWNTKATIWIKYKWRDKALYVRVLSLRSSVIHGFVTEPWYSHHVRVFMWARGFECARVARSLVCVPCFMLERGVWIPALMSCVLVTWRGSDTRAPFSVIVWVRGLEFARHRALLSTCVLLCYTQFVFLSAACSYVICCAVWHAACIFIGCVLSCCLVWTRGLWVFSLAACSCPVLHMAGDLFAGHVLVFLFYVSTWLLS